MKDIEFLSQPASAETAAALAVPQDARSTELLSSSSTDATGASVSMSKTIRICRANTGAGGEQLLTIEQPSDEGLSAGAYAAMRIFNIDGKDCGNATRCMVYLLLEETGKDEVRIETTTDVLQCRRAGLRETSVTVGPISIDWRKISLSREADTPYLPVESGPLKDGIALNVGNPHAVLFVDRLDKIDIPRYAPAVQNDSLFPEGANAVRSIWR